MIASVAKLVTAWVCLSWTGVVVLFGIVFSLETFMRSGGDITRATGAGVLAALTTIPFTIAGMCIVYPALWGIALMGGTAWWGERTRVGVAMCSLLPAFLGTTAVFSMVTDFRGTRYLSTPYIEWLIVCWVALATPRLVTRLLRPGVFSATLDIPVSHGTRAVRDRT